MTMSKITRALITVGGAAGLVFTMQGSAWAAQTATIPGVGYGQWQADPDGSIPGDSIRACDNVTDTFGIQVQLDIGRDGDIDRFATTEGHNATYCSAWKSGNIAEGTPITIWVYKVRGGEIYGPSAYLNGTA
ncbi:hypothetical protein ACFV0Y_00475 [Streptomyces sp. NPDC059569]|uniref:hypothetical protein n=1 Tax=Streptomyces sp. NPDC059569 TaxID=3346869 RepID=UPI0036AAB21F